MTDDAIAITLFVMDSVCFSIDKRENGATVEFCWASEYIGIVTPIVAIH